MFDNTSDGAQVESETNQRPWSGIVDRVRQMNYGDTIPTGALYLAAGLSESLKRNPSEPDAKFQKRCERNRLKFASLFDRARRELLRSHKRDLRSSKPGEYQLVKPSQQAELAQKDALREARAALASGARRAEHVNASMVGDADRKRASDIEAHLDSLRGMIKPRK